MKTQNTALPASVLTKKQTKTFGPLSINYGGTPAWITATVRYDDECGNGHNSFAITAEIVAKDKRCGWLAGGCCHDKVAAAFPELAPFIKWHLTSTDGPMHYEANAIYHAGDRDCNGLRNGESQQVINGRTGLPSWTLEAVNTPGVRISQTPTGKEFEGRQTVPLFILDNYAQAKDGGDLPTVPALRWIPLCKVGEGKARDFDAARSGAVWPDATDAELSQEPEALRAQLRARLPALMADFKAAVESLGFTY